LYKGYRFYSLLGGGEGMRKERASFSEEKKEILKQMKPKIINLKEKFNSIFRALNENTL